MIFFLEILQYATVISVLQEYVTRTVPEFSATNEGSDQDYVVYLQTVISGKE